MKWLFVLGILARALSTSLVPINISTFFSIFVFLVFYMANAKRFNSFLGSFLLLTGALSNLIVYVANGLRMPALLKEMGITIQYYKHAIQMSEETNLNFLGDWIRLGDNNYSSPGDILMTLGWLIIMIYFVYQKIVYHKTR